ncbi:polysaccharide deacetylase family protein [Paenibacillus allorhizosphaerae]|uniref:NodB homology domain-containing protein n=1 Tax=Paenibacillus allorhizosphaerae TaxID=2849866 RepID=A0ABN7TYN7_9BACL|nr:polysaccharide deacetylase family protein [Paenibacillus allorhizosphaerae]CAG7657445.1 hypothetical protein PAECIP111802_06728 [Paenibacillus allorhizosphaerae]
MIHKLFTGLLLAVVLLGAFDVFSSKYDFRYHDQVAVLMYHHVHDSDESSSTITSRLFRDQLTYLQKLGYHFISLSEFKAFHEGGAVPDKAVFVTFDDGYESFHQYAYPILKELGIPAVNFVVTKELADPKAPSIPALSKEEIREMLAYKPGMFDFQCHSDNLHYKEEDKAALTNPLGTEGGVSYADRILSDTKACVGKLNELYGQAQSATAYAYPFGIYTTASEELITEGGIRYAFTIVNEMATRASKRLEIPRINAGNPKIQPEHLHKQIMLRVQRAN